MKKKIALVLLLLLTLCGCTKRFTVEGKDGDKKSSKTYVSNIICKPEEEDNINIYTEHKDDLLVDYDKLPACKDLKITSGGYEGLWTSFFVKPLAWIIVKLGVLVKSYGLAIMIIGVVIRALMMPITKKSNNMNNSMQKAQKELNALEKKYAGRNNDRDAMMAKSQEMLMIYKKYGINPMSSCLFAFIQLPIFFALLEAIYRVPVFFEKKFSVYNLGMTPAEGLLAHNYWYIILVVLIIATTYFSFKNMNTNTVDEMQAKQMKMMSTFMVVFISIISFSLPTSIALYWIVSNAFTIVQNMILKKGK